MAIFTVAGTVKFTVASKECEAVYKVADREAEKIRLEWTWERTPTALSAS